MAAELIIFDCDGVLVDSEIISCRCTTEVLNELGIDIDEATVREKFVGISAKSMAARIKEEWSRVLSPEFRAEIEARTLHAFTTELQPIGDVRRALDCIAIPRCVASSGTPERIRHALTVTGLFARLEPHLFSATMVEHGKPAPDLFLLAAARMHVPPQRCIVVEDSIAGAKAGRAAGMRVFGFTGASHIAAREHAPRLLEAGAELTFQSMSDLPGLVADVGGRDSRQSAG